MHYKLNQVNILLRKLHIGKKPTNTWHWVFPNPWVSGISWPPTSPNTSGLPYPMVPQPQIQPTLGGKFQKKNVTMLLMCTL